jgi:hypothetical protein
MNFTLDPPKVLMSVGSSNKVLCGWLEIPLIKLKNKYICDGFYIVSVGSFDLNKSNNS